MSDTIKDIEKLAQLRDNGVLTEEEFQKKKSKLLEADDVTPETSAPGNEWTKKTFWGYVFLSVLLPIVGFIIGIAGMTKGGKKVRQGIALVIISVGIAGLYIAAVSGGEPSQSAVVRSVQDGTLEGYPFKTLGEAVDGFLQNPRWEHVRGKDNNDYVNITGRTSFMDSTVDVLLQYRVDRQDGSFELQAFEMNDVPQNMIMYNGLLSAMYGE